MTTNNQRWLGILFVLFGASFWGIGGTAADYLFQTANIDVNWYVTTRLICSGLLLLGIQLFLKGWQSVFAIWLTFSNWLPLFAFALFGMLLVQYSYMASIHEGNAAVATLLQYLAPVYIILWLLLRRKQSFQWFDLIAIGLTIVGTLLLLTNGSFSQLTVPGSAILWGIISGLSLAFYTLYARRLTARYSSIVVVGWAMLIAGVTMSFIHPIWAVDVSSWSFSTSMILFFTIVFGTAIAFWFIIKSLDYLQAKETTLLGTLEPLTAVVSSVLWLNLTFGIWQVVGMVFILTLVVSLSLQKTKRAV
ncbi:DMT family transporter [Alkalihalobacillus sp. LMS6]|uniref:EamA family transporter n=1 Tax=Bacillaceae TaxID=186817 RepID=UPI000C0731FB|nr:MULTISPECIES: DMT family transporter [Bacillaceae]UTR06926.1 DMT family transporter [Alkalihalobacillus sp. LMS6]